MVNVQFENQHMINLQWLITRFEVRTLLSLETLHCLYYLTNTLLCYKWCKSLNASQLYNKKTYKISNHLMENTFEFRCLITIH